MSESKRKVVRAGIGYTIGNYLIKGLNFLTIPIFTRMMSVAEYGKYSTYVSYESVLFVFVGLGIFYSIKSARHKYGNKLDDYITSTILLILINTLFIGILLNIGYPLYKSVFLFPILIADLLLLHSLGSALLTIYNAFVGLEYKYKNYVSLALINAIISIVVSVILIFFLPTGFKHYGRIIGAAVPIIGIGIYVLYYFSSRTKLSYSREYWLYGFKFGLPMIPHGLSVVILSQFDRIMINSMVGPVETGTYSFAYNLYMVVSVTATSLSNVWGPWFFKQMEVGNYQSIKKNSSLYAFGMMVFTILVMLISPELVLILGGRQYAEAIYCVLPVIAGGYFAYLYTIPVQVEYYKERTNWVAFASASAALINVTLNYFFIKQFGYIAAAYTTLFTYILYFLFHLALGVRLLDKNERKTFSVARLCVAGVGTIVGCFISLVLVNNIFIRVTLAIILIIFIIVKFKLPQTVKNTISKNISEK